MKASSVSKMNILVKIKNLTYNDVLSIKGKDKISAASGIYNNVNRLDDLNIFASTTGVNKDFDEVNKLDLKYSRFISRDERIQKSKVAVNWPSGKY